MILGGYCRPESGASLVKLTGAAISRKLVGAANVRTILRSGVSNIQLVHALGYGAALATTRTGYGDSVPCVEGDVAHILFRVLSMLIDALLIDRIERGEPTWPRHQSPRLP